MLLSVKIMLIQSRLLAIDQVEQACIVGIRRQSDRCELGFSRRACSIDLGIGVYVQFVRLALIPRARNTESEAKVDLHDLC